MRILVVEDNSKTAEFIRKGLTQNAYTVDTAYDGKEGLHLIVENQYDLVILDVMLPSMGGWELARKIKAIHRNLPILFLTARDSIEDRLKGFDCGADDYIIKPFSFAELLARMRTILRRPYLQQDMLLQIADLKVDPIKHVASRGGKRLQLSAKEFMLLLLFMRRQGEVLSRTYIAEHVWDINFDSETNAIEVAIKRLRDKIDLGYTQKTLHTIRGVGYVMEIR